MPMYHEAARANLLCFRPGSGGTVAPDAHSAYRSSFGRWNERASVRSKPTRVLEECPEEQLYFPPETVPIASHPLVSRLGEPARRRLLVQLLCQYLHFTTELEELAVIPIASKISRGKAGLVLPQQMREDAFKIVTDEAWHAQFSYDLMRQVASKTGVLPRLPELPRFVTRLDRIRSGLPSGVRGAEALAFAVVSETLISVILAEIPRDQRLPRAVRESVRDHAEDEGRHHAYFRSVLDYFWAALEPAEHRQIGPCLPQVIFAFLKPDYPALVEALSDIGLGPEEIDQVLCESYPEVAVTEFVADAAANTVRYFGEVGALDDTQTRDAFLAAGLITA